MISGNRLLQEETHYDVEELKRRVDENKARFNGEQLGAFNEVMDSVDNNLGKMIFIHSAGGCGKTFVCNTLASAVWSNGDVALCVASSGIAALLLSKSLFLLWIHPLPILKEKLSYLNSYSRPICNDNSVTGLISSTYPHIDHHQDDQYYLDCTILSGKNSDVEDINSEVLQKCSGEEKILQSADSIISDDGNPNGLGLYPMVYLNSLRASSLPLAKLALKIGVPVMLLRNLDTTK
ncbi:hypothetical protein J132_06756 [Termitomyces sp. J132]|nr:hypothetical protein J132_06756 [Termitomyces sp. J132]